MGLSENRENPIYPMVFMIIIPMKNCYFIGNIPYFQTNPFYGDRSSIEGDMKYDIKWLTQHDGWLYKGH